MPETLTLRVTLESPLPGVALAVQKGRDELILPVRADADAVTFEVPATLRLRPDGTQALAGPIVQGPAGAKFLYVTVGKRAGQPFSPWDRRVKVPLSGITPELLSEAAASSGMVLAARIHGLAKDGGPACASVPLLGSGWQLEPVGK